MANDLGKDVVRMTNALDRVVREGTKTSDLNMNGDLIGQFVGVGQVEVPKIEMDGLTDYNRNDGYVQGGVDLEWEIRKLEYDRGRGFDIDDMDDEEHLRLVSSNLMGEFARTKVVPEVDAIRFMRIYQNAGKSVDSAFGDDPEKLIEAMLDAQTDFEDAGNSLAGSIIYCTAAVKNLLRKGMPYRMGMGEAPNMEFDTFNSQRLITVPKDRFYTEIDLDKSTAATTKGNRSMGYTKGASAKGIDFMIVNPAVCQAITKHETLRYFSPEVYQKANAHHWDYRLFHDLIVLDNAKNGILASVSED